MYILKTKEEILGISLEKEGKFPRF